MTENESVCPLRSDAAYENQLVDQLDVTNYGLSMESMLISEFKAKAIATLKRVRDTGEPVLVTIRGVAVAEIFPPRTVREEGVVLGACSQLTVERPPDAQLIAMGSADEWEMNQ